MQLTKQIGEYLVAAELAKRGFVSTTFSGSVPDFDIAAVGQDGTQVLVQVKTIRAGDWQMNAHQFADIQQHGDYQRVQGSRKAPPNIWWVLVHLSPDLSAQTYYVLTAKKMYQLAYTHYVTYLKTHTIENKRKSTHMAIKQSELAAYEDKWPWPVVYSSAPGLEAPAKESA